MAVQADVADREQVRKMVDNVLEKFCQLDILVCNAGVSETGLISEIDEAHWRRIFAVNVDGMHYCCQAVLPHMIHRKSGSIITGCVHVGTGGRFLRSGLFRHKRCCDRLY